MAPSAKNGLSDQEADFAKVKMLSYTPMCDLYANIDQAFEELAKGERTADALENHLSDIEARIEALLAQATRDKTEVEQAKVQTSSTSLASTEEKAGVKQTGPQQ